MSVNDPRDPNGGQPADASVAHLRSVSLLVLTLLLWAEALLLGAVAVYLVVELVTQTPASYASAVMILLLVLIAAAWVGWVAISTWRCRPWVRGGIVVWQFMQISVGVGSLQGIFARPDVGWALIIPALVALMLLFTRDVMAATARRDERPGA